MITYINNGIIQPGYTLKIKYTDKQPGDVDITYTDTKKFEKNFGKLNHTPLQIGLNKFIKWYKVK